MSLHTLSGNRIVSVVVVHFFFTGCFLLAVVDVQACADIPVRALVTSCEVLTEAYPGRFYSLVEKKKLKRIS